MRASQCTWAVLHPGDGGHGAQYDQAHLAGRLAVPRDDEDVRLRVLRLRVDTGSDDEGGQDEARQGRGLDQSVDLSPGARGLGMVTRV